MTEETKYGEEFFQREYEKERKGLAGDPALRKLPEERLHEIATEIARKTQATWQEIERKDALPKQPPTKEELDRLYHECRDWGTNPSWAKPFRERK